jgi:hypothetical protein
MVELVFIHLPKTGGSSLLKTFQAIYGEEHVRHFERDECLQLNKDSKRISDVITDSTRVIHGHFRYKEVEDIIKRDQPKVVTFLREPVSRVVSNYTWWKHNLKNSTVVEDKKRFNEPIEEYIQHEQTRNKMAFFLEGIRLKDLFFIGFLERFNEDLELLAKALEWPESPIFHEKNSTNFSAANKEVISEKLKKQIMKLNKRDLRLYNRALQREKMGYILFFGRIIVTIF